MFPDPVHDPQKSSIYSSPRFNKVKNYLIGTRSQYHWRSSLKMAALSKKGLYHRDKRTKYPSHETGNTFFGDNSSRTRASIWRGCLRWKGIWKNEKKKWLEWLELFFRTANITFSFLWRNINNYKIILNKETYISIRTRWTKRKRKRKVTESGGIEHASVYQHVTRRRINDSEVLRLFSFCPSPSVLASRPLLFSHPGSHLNWVISQDRSLRRRRS